MFRFYRKVKEELMTLIQNFLFYLALNISTEFRNPTKFSSERSQDDGLRITSQTFQMTIVGTSLRFMNLGRGNTSSLMWGEKDFKQKKKDF